MFKWRTKVKWENPLGAETRETKAEPAGGGDGFWR